MKRRGSCPVRELPPFLTGEFLRDSNGKVPLGWSGGYEKKAGLTTARGQPSGIPAG